jgi:hypothetical protein
MKEIKQFKGKYNKNKPLEKLNKIEYINDSINKKKKFTKILFDKYINKEKEQDLTKINNMFKYLYTIFIVFAQFFLAKEKFNEENIDLYLIYIFILIDFKENLFNKVKTESKKHIIKNIEYLFYDKNRNFLNLKSCKLFKFSVFVAIDNCVDTLNRIEKITD